LHGNNTTPGTNILGGRNTALEPGHRFSTVLTEESLNRPALGGMTGRNSLGGLTGGDTLGGGMFGTNTMGGGLMGRNSLGAPVGGGLLGNNDKLLHK